MDLKTVEKIANLSRLKLTPEEADSFSKHFTLILDQFKEIENVDTQGITPLVTPVQLAAHIVKDEAVKIYTSEAILANAPEKSGHLFKVPPVVGG